MKKLEEYVCRIKEGDENAFSDFIQLYSKDLFYYAQCFVKTKELAEEVVSDVFFDVWNNREKVNEIQRMKAWLLTLTHNKAISYLRKEENSRSTISWDEISDFQFIGHFQTPDEKMISEEKLLQINSIIETLPPKCKMVFVLAKIERLSYKEISEILNLSVKTINVHIANALERVSMGLKDNT